MKDIQLEETKVKLRSVFKNSLPGVMYIPSDYEIEVLKKDKKLMKKIILVEKDLNKFFKKVNESLILCDYKHILDEDNEIHCLSKDERDFYCYKNELIKDDNKNYTLIYNTTFDVFELENKNKSNGTI